MANSTTVFHAISNDVLLCSLVFKFIAMIVGVLGNVTVIIYTIFFNKEKTATSYLTGNLALADLLVCLTFYPIWIIEFIQIMLNIDNDQDLFCKFSRATMWAFMFASIATLFAITVDRYLYIVRPLRYPYVVTHRRVFLAVSGVWVGVSCLFVVWYIQGKNFGTAFRSLCQIQDSIYIATAFAGYLFLCLTIFLNFYILSVARKQRRRIFAETMISGVDNATEKSAKRISVLRRFFVALKAAKTFSIVVAVLTFSMLTPSVVGQMINTFCTDSCWRIWFVVFQYEIYGVNSVVNAFIYGMRHVRYRKAFLYILLKLFSCRKTTK